jgi:hypothetical protein
VSVQGRECINQLMLHATIIHLPAQALQEHALRSMHSLLGLLTDGMPCDVLIRNQLIMGQPAGGGHTSFVVQC